jgi:hypothetical protein
VHHFPFVANDYQSNLQAPIVIPDLVDVSFGLSIFRQDDVIDLLSQQLPKEVWKHDDRTATAMPTSRPAWWDLQKRFR